MILSISSSVTLSPLADVSFQFDGWNTSGLVALLLIGLAAYVFYIQINAIDHKWMRRKDPSLVVIAHPQERKARAQGLFRTPPAPPVSAQPNCKRKDKRRSGNPVDVHLADAAGKQPTYDAVVIDRSRGGLCIMSDRSARVGQILKVRALNAPDTVDWLPIEVRHCKEKNGRYRFGCAFKEKPPWGVVLLFG